MEASAMHVDHPHFRFSSIVLLAILGLALTAPYATADGMEDARRRGRLLVGVKTDFPPFGFIDTDGTIAGFDADIARHLATKLFDDDKRLELVKVTSGSRVPFLYSRWVDMIVATTTVTEERMQVLEFSEPYFLSGSLILVPQSSPIRDLGDLSGKTVGVIEGAIQSGDLKQVAPAALQHLFETVDEAVASLKDGEVDAFCQDDVLIVSLAMKDPGLKAVGRPFLPRPYAVAVRKGETVFLRWIDRQLEEMRNDGTYGKLWQKHFGEMQEHLVIP
jgi:ABC-type amino acid transport substrate-binding protein